MDVHTEATREIACAGRCGDGSSVGIERRGQHVPRDDAVESGDARQTALERVAREQTHRRDGLVQHAVAGAPEVARGRREIDDLGVPGRGAARLERTVHVVLKGLPLAVHDAKHGPDSRGPRGVSEDGETEWRGQGQRHGDVVAAAGEVVRERRARPGGAWTRRQRARGAGKFGPVREHPGRRRRRGREVVEDGLGGARRPRQRQQQRGRDEHEREPAEETHGESLPRRPRP